MNLNRREFLQAAAGAAAVACCAEPAPLRPARILDTHTHFFDPSRPQGVPWPPKDNALLYRTTLPATYRALPQPQPGAGGRHGSCRRSRVSRVRRGGLVSQSAHGNSLTKQERQE